MSDTVNTAEIKVVVDGEGVETGLRKIEESAGKTSRTIDNLGSGPGLRPLGEGATGAAGQIDKSTKNMADAIQRATAAMSSGAKGSAEYYAALANSRGLKMDALRPYLAQLDEATKRAAAAAAAQKQLDDSMKFLADLKSRTDSIGKTASELMELRAAELGVADAARPMIERMRQAEQAAEDGANKFGKFGAVAEKAKGILLALGAGAALGAFAAAVSASVDNLADLDDMAQKTGSSIESLSRLQRVATVFAADMGQIDAALSKLARGMTSVDDEGSKVDRALKAIGLSAKDASGNLRDPSELMADIAKKLQGYNDGAGKAALATDLFGKAGADLLPYLNDLAENYDTMAASSTAAATAASQLQDQIGFAKLRFNDMANAVATAALPALSDLAGAMSDVLKSENDLSGGKGAEWADDLAVGLARVADVAMLLPRVFGAVTNSFKVVAADIEFLTAVAKLRNPASVAAEYARGNDPLAGIKKAASERNRVLIEANTKYDELWNKPADQFEQAILKRIASRTSGAAAAAAGGGTDLNYSSTDKQGKEAEKAAEAYQNLIGSIKEKIAMTAAEAASLTPLTESQKLQISLDEMMADSKRKLTPERKAEVEAAIKALAANEEVIASQKRAAQGAADWLKIEKEWRDAADKTIDAATKEAERNEELARTFGMTKSAIEAVELARLEEQLAQRSSLGLTLTEIENLEKLIDAKKRNRDALASVEVQDANKKAADKAVADWQRSAEQIGQSLTDNLMRGGKSAADYLRDLFRTLVLRPIIQPIGNAIGGFITTAMGMPGAAQAADGKGVDLATSVSNMYNALKSGGTFEQTISQGVQSGFEKMGFSSGTSSTAGSWAGQIGGTIGGYMIGSSLNKGISSGYETGSGFMTLQKVATAAASAVFGPVGGAIAGAVSGLVNRAFGMRPKEYAGTSSLVGSLSAGAFAGTVDTAWTQKGGWFRSDKSGTDKAAVDAEMAKGLGAGYEAIKAASADFAKTLGINADFIKDRAQAVNIALGKDEAANQKAIADFFVGVGNTIAGELLPSLSQFQQEGEQASATLQRLATGYALVDTALTSIGMSFGSVGTQSLEARERLLAAAGGLDAFAANTAGFQQNFLTEAERNAPVLKSVTEQLAAMGLSSVDTREEFKAVVLGLNLTTEAGANQYGMLMKLAAGFAQVTPAMASLAEINKPYLDQIRELELSLMSTTDRRAAEIAGMDASTVALYGRVAGLKLEASARDKAAAEAKSLQDQLDELIMSPAQLAEKARNAIDPANRARYDEIQAIKAQKDANEKATQVMNAARESAASFVRSFGDAIMGSIQRAEQAAKALHEFNDSLVLGNLSALDPDARYRAAKKQFEAADANDTQAMQAFLQASKDRGVDAFYYDRDFAAVQTKLARGIADADAYAARLPDFYRGFAASMATPAFTPAVPPAIVQTGSMSKKSAQQSPSDTSELKGEMAELRKTNERMASSMDKLTDMFDRVSNNGSGLVLEGA